MKHQIDNDFLASKSAQLPSKKSGASLQLLKNQYLKNCQGLKKLEESMEHDSAVVKKTDSNDSSRLSNSEMDLLLQSLAKDDEYNSFRSYLLNNSISTDWTRDTMTTLPMDDKMTSKQQSRSSANDADLDTQQSSQHQLLRKMMSIIDDRDSISSASNVKIRETDYMNEQPLTTTHHNLIPYYAIWFLMISNVYGYLLIGLLDGIHYLNGRVAHFLRNFWLKLKHFSTVQKENVFVLQICVLPIFILISIIYATLWLSGKVVGLFVKPVPQCIAKFVHIKYYVFEE